MQAVTGKTNCSKRSVLRRGPRDEIIGGHDQTQDCNGVLFQRQFCAKHNGLK